MEAKPQLSRNLNMAREGYKELDSEKSKMAHLGMRRKLFDAGSVYLV